MKFGPNRIETIVLIEFANDDRVNIPLITTVNSNHLRMKGKADDIPMEEMHTPNLVEFKGGDMDVTLG